MKAKDHIYYILKERFGSKLVLEYKGIPGRRFRFDFCVPEYRLALEYDGMFSQKSRHLTVTGFTMDAQKLNLAQLHGWTVLRYTVLNYKDLTNDLKLWEQARVSLKPQ